MSDSQAPNETHSDANNPVEDATPCSSPPTTDSESEFPDSPTDSESEFLDSPTDSILSEPFEPDLKGPAPNEDPQYRGRITHNNWQAGPILINPVPHVPAPAPPLPPPAHIHHHPGGANPPIVQGIAPFDPAEAPPNPPDHH